MLKAIAAGLAVLSIAALPASAEPRDPDAAASYYIKPADLCMKARKDETLTLEQRVHFCSLAKEKLTEKFNAPDYAPQSGFERNFYWFARAVVEAQLMGLYGDMDGVRTKRVCERAEAQAAALDRIDQTAWPQKYAEETAKAVDSVKSPLAKCRAEFPDGG